MTREAAFEAAPAARPAGRRGGVASFLWALPLLAVSLAFQLYAVRTRTIPVGADQAVVGLMADHILAGRGHPVFYFGAAYAGTLEAHYLAAVFALLGSSPESYRIAMSLLLAGLSVGVFLLARRVFGPAAALVSLAYLSIPPFFFLYKGLTSDGAYDSVALCALAALAAAFAIDRTALSPFRRPWLYLLLGLVVGVGWWVMPLTAAVSAVAVGWLFLRRAPRPGRRGALLIAAGAVVGAFPWWVWNLRHDWASLKAPELGTVGPALAARHLLRLGWISLPVLEGGISLSPDVRRVGRSFPYSAEISLVCLAVLLGFSLWRALRGDRDRRLLLLALAAVLGVAILSRRFLETEPRYLVAYYAIVPLLVGAEAAAATSRRFSWLPKAALAALLFIHGASVLSARVTDRNADDEVTGRIGTLIRRLEAMGIHHAYANYWTAYRLVFESRERIAATPFPGDELVRIASYRQAVDAAPRPAVVQLDTRDRCFESFLRENALRFRRVPVGPFGVYWDLEPAALETLRRGVGLALPSDAYRVEWRLSPQPREMAAGESVETRARVCNLGPCLWPNSVHLAYHWWPLAPGLPEIYDGPRGILPDVITPPDHFATYRIDLVAPPIPGRYRLEYDLVHENVAWFSDRGGQTASVDVRVVPAPSDAARKAP